MTDHLDCAEKTVDAASDHHRELKRQAERMKGEYKPFILDKLNQNRRLLRQVASNIEAIDEALLKGGCAKYQKQSQEDTREHRKPGGGADE